MIMTNTKYNGWKNRETWLLNVWYGDFFSDSETGTWDAEAIRDFIEEEVFGEDCGNVQGFVADLIDLSIIDYYELAEHFEGEE